MRFILTNGPSGSGKDTFAQLLSNVTEQEIYTFSLAGPIKDATIDVLDRSGVFYADAVDLVYGRESKDSPLAALNGLSPREFGIRYAEEFIKPNLGKDYFVKVLLTAVMDSVENEDAIIVIPDVGFIEEAEFLKERINEDATIEFVFLSRQGHKWNESRISLYDWVEENEFPFTLIWNNGTIDDLFKKAKDYMGN